MITHKIGDLLDSSLTIIGHGVNCQGAMGAGIAKAIKAKYPEAFSAYKELCDKYNPFDYGKESNRPEHLLGKSQFVRVNNNRRVIINLFTQLNYGRGTKLVSYDAVDTCMLNIGKQFPANNNGLTIGFPKIGAGLGGGHWNVIEEIIKYRLNHINVEIYSLENN